MAKINNIIRLKNKDDDDIAPMPAYYQVSAPEGFVANYNSNSGITYVDAPVKDKRKWFQKGAFEDGYQFGDITKTILGTNKDFATNILAGGLRIGEAAVDAGAYVAGAVGGLVGADGFQSKMENFIEKDLYDEVEIAEKILDSKVWGFVPGGQGLYLMGKAENAINEDSEEVSILGERSDSLVQSGGQLLAQAGLQMAGVPWWVTSGVSSFGTEVEQAFNADATWAEAGISGVINAGAEILTEKLFGGSGLGEVGLINTSGLTKGISNKVVKLLLDYGINMTTEGAEEVASSIFQKFGTALYSKENLWDLLTNEEALDEYAESFIGGMVLGGGMNVGKAVDSAKTGRDYNTGLTTEEQEVVDKEVEARVAEREANGEKVSKKEKARIYDEVVEDMDSGAISVDRIEEILGGDTYKTYKAESETEKANQEEYDKLYRMKSGDKSDADIERQAELKKLLDEGTKSTETKTRLGDEVFELVKNTRLGESYNEIARRSTKYEADTSKYDEAQRKVIQSAIDSGILNNTNRTHRFVDMVAKISADKGVSFDFTNNARLKDTGFAVDGAQVNAYVTKDGITLNINSAKALNSVVGHEIAHVLEGTELYSELQSLLFNYAESKGDLKNRRALIEKLYKNVKDANIDAEITADLIGDYLFTDRDFIRRLSVENKNVFQKIFDEIKYLARVATAGSKEARELERVKKMFEDVYREGGKAESNTNAKYSLVVKGIDGSETVVNANNITRTQTLEYIENSFKRKYVENSYFPVALHTPQTIISSLENAGIEIFDKPIAMQAKKARQAQIEGKIHAKDGYVIRGHAMKAEEVLQVVEKLDKPIAIIQETELTRRVVVDGEVFYEDLPDRYAVFVDLNNGSEYVAVLEFDSEIAPEFIVEDGADDDYHTTVTVFKPDVTRNGEPFDYLEYLSLLNGNYEIEVIEKRPTLEVAYGENLATTSNEGLYGDKVPQNKADVKYSLSDSDGRQLTTDQLENVYQYNVENGDVFGAEMVVEQAANLAMPNSKIRGEDGKLIPVYHGTKDMFYTFDTSVKGGVNGTAEGFGIYLSDNPEVTEAYGDRQIKMYANITKPATSTQKTISPATLAKLIKDTCQRQAQQMVADGEYDSVKDALMDTWVSNYVYTYGIGMESAYREVAKNILQMNDSDMSVIQEVMSGMAIRDYATATDFYRNSLTPITGFDGFATQWKSSATGKPSNIYLAFDSSQLKSADAVTYDDNGNVIPLSQRFDPTNKDIRYSLSENTQDNGVEYAPVRNTATTANNITAPVAEQTAQILTEEPKQPKKKSKAWKWAKEHILDSGMVFEDLSLKTGNRELQARWNSIRYADKKAQKLIGDGDETTKSLKSIQERVEKSGKTKQFYAYLYHMHNADRMTLANRFPGVENKPVFGNSVTAEMSREITANLLKNNPEFKQWAEDVYAYNRRLRSLLVQNGVISIETAKLWEQMYPHYVPIRREGDVGLNVNVPLDTGRTGINAPVKRATGGNGNILPLFDTMGQRTMQTYKAIAKNRFGVELMNTLGTTIENQAVGVDEAIDSIDTQDSLLQEGINGMNPTFTVFENGEKVTFEITDEMYEALKPTSELFASTSKVLNTASNFRRSVLTEYNPWFMLKNAVKDVQDVLINSQHPAKTYAAIPKAIGEIADKGRWYQEYMANGGDQNTYFDKQSNTFTKENPTLEAMKKWSGLNFIQKANNVVEMIPRLSEYIASREAGRSIDVSMLDAARVTTNFAAGGDVTKWLNRNGATFLNASVQGVMQQARNIREAKMNGLRGWASLAAKFTIAGLPAIILNNLIWDDDEDYAELSDYVKEGYYIVGKFDDGKFVRIPKGRTVAVIQNAFEQISNAITGDDEVDLKAFVDLVISNLAPNNPLENNIFSPIVQVAKNETWYGEDLVPSRLQDLPAGEQYDESTDMISRWLGETFNISPYKVNYLIDQYSGVIGDTFLPMLTPEAESGNDSFLGNMIAPLKDMFITDSVMKNQNVSDFYETKDELAVNAKASNATDEDILKYKYLNTVNAELSDLYKQKREIQNSDLPDAEKYAQVREIQRQIDAITKNAMETYESVNIEGENYATLGDYHYRKNENGEWQRITDEQLEKQNAVTSSLNITPSEYWSNKEEYDYAYKNMDKYNFLKENGITYEEYKNADDDFKDAYTWAYENPGGYALSKVVAGDVVTYKQYSNDLNNIHADKDANGKSISGSRKSKVLEYINNMDIDYGQKLILFKYEYPSTDTYNYEIIEYLNSRDDISYSEMKTILIELGFTVDANGNISW